MKKVIILAAGKGTRMKSDLPKVMHQVAGLPMLEHVIDNTKIDDEVEVIAVVGHKKEIVQEYFGDSIKYAVQEEQLGTGHAVMVAIDHISDDDEVVITCGDTPLISKETFEKLFEEKSKGFDAVVLTSCVDNPTGYGRILKKDNLFNRIVEEKDATEEEKAIKEVNVGTYIINGLLLKKYLKNISNDNSQKEYYLTDVFEQAGKENKVSTLEIKQEDMLGINSKLQLSEAERILRKKINEHHMENGVTFINPEAAYIEKSVVIGKDVIIYPNVFLRGNTIIADNVTLRENTTIENSKVGEYTCIQSSTIFDSEIGKNVTMGPFAYLRPNSKVGNNCRVGDFIEIKNSSLDDGTKASHFAYIGDAQVGKKVNISCGVVFANYDGVNKFKTIVEDNVFIGSNANLVAPVKIGEGSFIAAGSTITDDVPPNTLAIARERQVNKIRKDKKD